MCRASCFLTLCASVGNKNVSTLFDARCNHEVYQWNIYIDNVFSYLCLCMETHTDCSNTCILLHVFLVCVHTNIDVFLTVHHSIDFFKLPT